jgi:hypothetical protein
VGEGEDADKGFFFFCVSEYVCIDMGGHNKSSRQYIMRSEVSRGIYGKPWNSIIVMSSTFYFS